MGKYKLQEFLLDLGKNVESKSHNLQVKAEPKTQIGATAALGLTKSQRKKQKQKRSLLKKTIGTAPFNQERPDVETVVFRNPSGISRKEGTASRSGNKTSKDEETGADMIDLRKASFEVMKFSINSMKGSEKEDAETRLAISLGAEPPKNKYINYKELQEIRKVEKQQKQAEEKNSIKPDLKQSIMKKSHGRPSGKVGKGKLRPNQDNLPKMRHPMKSSRKKHSR